MTSDNNIAQLRTNEQLVADLTDLLFQADEVDARIKTIKSQLAQRIGVGNSLDVNGVTVSVREPNRRFNAQRAAELVTPEVLELAKEVSPTKLKQFLSPVLLDTCMDAGTGAPIVSVR